MNYYLSTSRYSLLVLFMLFPCGLFAQKAERSYLRKGNRQFGDSLFVDAEVSYRKALDANSRSSVSMYNLGNALTFQNKHKEAMEQYTAAASLEKNKHKLGQIYHNMGVLLQTGKDYAKAVEAYKQALRNNPADDETRYNLALAQKMLKDQQQQQNQNKDQQKNEQEQERQKQNEQQQNEQKQPPKTDKEENKLSKENAEQLLNSVVQDEKNVQDKVKKQQRVIQTGQLEKNW